MDRDVALLVVVIVLIGIMLIGGLMWAIPTYKVWQQGLSGKAKLAEAEYGRQVLVQEAKAKKEAATLLAEAEVERAKGVAKANEIIGSSLKGHEEYLRYLWITQLEKSSHEVIYVPTEAQMPILEATRLQQQK